MGRGQVGAGKGGSREGSRSGGWRSLRETREFMWIRSSSGVGGLLGGFPRGSLWVGSGGEWGRSGAEAHLGLGGSCGPPPCSFFTSISLLRLRASRSFPKEPLRRKEPLPSCGADVCLYATLTTQPPGPPKPLDSPRSIRLQALPPRVQTQAEPQHPRSRPGCHAGLPGHRCYLSAVPPPWSGLQGPGPEGESGRIGWSRES